MASSEAEEMCQPSHGVFIKKWHMHINVSVQSASIHVRCATTFFRCTAVYLVTLFLREAQFLERTNYSCLCFILLLNPSFVLFLPHIDHDTVYSEVTH